MTARHSGILRHCVKRRKGVNTVQSRIQDLVLKFVNVLTVVIIIVLVHLRARIHLH